MVTLEDVSFAYPQHSVSNDILAFPDLKLRAGEQLCVFGASGCGKSTLLHLIAGMLVPTSGAVSIAGTNLGALPAAERDAFRSHYIGIIFQQFNLLPYLSVIENVLLPTRVSEQRLRRARQGASGNEKKEAGRLLCQLGMQDDVFSRSVERLSVGQQQRVAAARALLGAPEIVLADEPTSALDPDTSHAFMDLLQAECLRQHSALVVVTHDPLVREYFTNTCDVTSALKANGRDE